jgi:hypothetical protein
MTKNHPAAFPATPGKSDDPMLNYARLVNNQLVAGVMKSPPANRLNPR